MNIAIVGTGYVGLVAGVCFADSGHRVTCVDNDQAKVDTLLSGGVPIYEPGLEELMKHSKERLEFTTDLASSVQKNDVVFIAVGTPETADGSADMGPTMSVLEGICKAANRKKYVVLKSTVPVGTAAKARAFVKEHCNESIEIINNPEFLKEGAAIDDFMKPDRVVIGCQTKEAKTVMWEIYEPFVRNGNPIYFMDNASAEMTKYAANAFLSVKISFINELARLADIVGADIDSVRRGFTSDGRINPSFFYPGVGFGGSCFPKDVRELIHTAKEAGSTMDIVEAADNVNDKQKLVLAEKVLEHFGDVKGKTFAMWGLSFKPRTDDVREAPAQYIIEKLTAAGAKIRAYDPVARETARAAFSSDFEICTDMMEVTQGADALLIVTEWRKFNQPNFDELKANLKQPLIFDGRNIFDPNKMRAMGFEYSCIGRKHTQTEVL